MRVAVIDVGSNSVRLLVASVGKSGAIKELRRARAYVRLGDDAYSLGCIGRQKLGEAAEVASRYARIARKAGVERMETIVTAPGRQASNGGELVRVLSDATLASVVILSADDEGRLAWEGAVRRMARPPKAVAVIDLGGGSCEVAVGRRGSDPSWVRSVEAGALRVTRAFLEGNPPTGECVANARAEIERLCSELEPPRPDATLAVGGTARAIGRIVGRRYGVDELEELVAKLSRAPAKSVTRRHGVSEERASTLLGGTLVLARLSRQLGCDLEVGRGGLREGAALALAGTEALAA